MPISPPLTLKSYLVDRDTGITSQGITQIVILSFIDENDRAHTFSLSKVDAYLLGQKLQAAGIDAQQS